MGALFKGVETNWQTLESLIDFAQELRESFGPDHARSILSDWDQHVESMDRVAHELARAIETIREYAARQPLPEMLWQRPSEKIADTLRPSLDTLQSAIDAIVQPWCHTDATLGEAIEAADNYYLARKKEVGMESHAQFGTLLRPHWNRAATDLRPLQAVHDRKY